MELGSLEFTCLPHITSKTVNTCNILKQTHVFIQGLLLKTHAPQTQISARLHVEEEAKPQASFGRALGSRVLYSISKKGASFVPGIYATFLLGFRLFNLRSVAS